MPRADLTATIHPATTAISPEVWDAMVPASRGRPDHPFLRHAFFRALEESGSATPETGWHPRHVLLTRENQPVGLLPLYLKTHSMGEYVFDHAWADAFDRAGGRYYPKLQSSIPFTPVTAPHLLVPSGNVSIQKALLDTAVRMASEHGISSIHATFVSPEEERLAEQAGWLTRRDIQFHWQNRNYSDFEDFLSSLASRKRKAIRRERQRAVQDGISIHWFHGPEITETLWDHFFEFYQDTGARKWGSPYLTRSFFSRISAAMPQSTSLVMARQEGRYIAGALNFSSSSTLYGRYWGCNRNVPFLHFELCYYQAIEHAIAHGLQRVEAGAQGPHKLARGYEATTTRSIHWLANPSLHDAVKNCLEQEREAVARDQEALDRASPFRKLQP